MKLTVWTTLSKQVWSYNAICKKYAAENVMRDSIRSLTEDKVWHLCSISTHQAYCTGTGKHRLIWYNLVLRYHDSSVLALLVQTMVIKNLKYNYKPHLLKTSLKISSDFLFHLREQFVHLNQWRKTSLLHCIALLYWVWWHSVF